MTARMESAMWIEVGKLAVEVVKAAAWPIAIVIIALRFRTGLVDALPALFRGKNFEIEAFGAKAKVVAAEQQQSAAENPATGNLPQTPALDPSPRRAVNTIETWLRSALDGIAAAQREPVLVRQLAEARLIGSHEFMYNRIFGSQIAALKRLNEVGRATVDAARQFFESVERQFPDFYSSYGFENWLRFLVGGGLIVQTGNALEISDFGRDFLMYLAERGLSENKPW